MFKKTQKFDIGIPQRHSGNSDFTLFFEGNKLYESMLKDIAAATTCIRIESYIFADDEIGWQFAQALAQRVADGINVYLHLDAAGFLFWGSRKLKGWLKEQGIKLRLYHRWRWRDPFRYNQRNHRKLLIIDDHKVYLGGYNFHRESSRSIVGKVCWRDTHLCMTGDIAKQAVLIFEEFWKGKRGELPVNENADNFFLPNFNRHCKQMLKCLYSDIFQQAQQTLWLTTPYFVPDRSIQKRLREAAKRGVDVRLLVPRKNDQIIVQWASRAAYANLLKAGVRIYEYLPRMLHAKTVVIDCVWATVGTSNLDYRSFFVNHEINLVTRDPLLCRQLCKQFETDLIESEQILTQFWVKRPWSAQVAELIGWMARRWL